MKSIEVLAELATRRMAIQLFEKSDRPEADLRRRMQ